MEIDRRVIAGFADHGSLAQALHRLGEERVGAGEILDGHQRLRACRDLGITNYPRRIIGGLDEDGKRDHAIRANCLRRQLTRQQRRDVIAAELRRDPRRSNRLLAALVGADQNTVRSVRDRLVAGAEIPHVGARDGKDGKVYAYRPPCSMVAAAAVFGRLADVRRLPRD